MNTSPDTFLNTVFEPPYSRPFFTGEEGEGRFLDMNSLYSEFLNLKCVREELRIGDYLWYLQEFDKFQNLPYSAKEKSYTKYKAYLNNLLAYMREFYKKSQPLVDFSKVHTQIVQETEIKWKEGTLKGWALADYQPTNPMDSPFYCEACKRQFANENTFVVLFIRDV